MSRWRRAVRRVKRWVRPADKEAPFRFVFIVTYGRSGSTLVQGLLNTLPRTLVRGENNFYVLELFRALARVRDFRQTHLAHNPRGQHSAFYGLHEITPRSFVDSARQLMTKHMLGSTPRGAVDVLGFKEVLWHRLEPEETEAFFAFLDRVFPDCLYVLNQRAHDKVVDSGFWQSIENAEVMPAILRVEDIQSFLRSSRPDRVLDLRYELVTSAERAVSDAELRRIAEFVHGPCDEAVMVAMRTTLTTGHGPFPFGASRGRGRRERGQPTS